MNVTTVNIKHVFCTDGKSKKMNTALIYAIYIMSNKVTKVHFSYF